MEFLPEGFALGSFDFLGCGLSDDQYISLGVRESEQIKSVVRELRRLKWEVVLWGRSMGAVSALRSAATRIIVADSPFVSLEKVCRETAQERKPRYFPGCMVACCFPIVFRKLRSDVKKKADFDLRELDTKKAVEELSPDSCLVFLSGDKDTLIHHRHAEELYGTFRGADKKLVIFAGSHNTKRPPEVLVEVMEYVGRMADRYFGEAVEGVQVEL